VVEELTESSDVHNAELLLDSDQHLFSFVMSEIRKSRIKLKVMTDSVRLLEAAKSQFTSSTSRQPLSSLYISALGGDIRGSAMLREFLLGIKKAPSNVLTQILSRITPFVADEYQKSLDPIRLQFKKLLQKVGDSKDTLKSQYDLKNETLRTTVVAHKVELSRHKANISEEDAAYSEIIDNFHDWLADYLHDSLLPASEIPFSEILIYDSRGPDKAVFMPKHRYVIERALSSPHDYLNCKCCKNTARDDTGEAALTKTQPCTALLYQLYTESGALINAADLWSAFNGILSEDGDDNEQKNM
jgi:origin recognition complex subunit 3